MNAGQPVELPINKSAVMNAKLAEWFSECVKPMHKSKKEEAVHC